MTTPGIDADSARERMRRSIESAAKLSATVTTALLQTTAETQALAEEAEAGDSPDGQPNT